MLDQSLVRTFTHHRYAMTPSVGVLNSAVKTWMARLLPPRECEQARLHFASEVITELHQKMKWRTSLSLNHDDVFASNLLGWTAYCTSSEELTGQATLHGHFSGSVAILLFLYENTQMNYFLDREKLNEFGPFIIDCANAWNVRNGRLPSLGTTFSQRVKYFEGLAHVGTECNALYQGTLEAANATLGTLLEVSQSCTIGLANGDIFYTTETVDYILRYLRAELGDVDLHLALQEIRQNIEGDKRDHSTVQGQLCTRLFHRLTAIMLLLSVLEEQSISEGFATPKARYLADMLVSGCQFHALRRGGPIEDYYMISWHNFSLLLLGGLALNLEEYPERIALDLRMLTTI